VQSKGPKIAEICIFLFGRVFKTYFENTPYKSPQGYVVFTCPPSNLINPIEYVIQQSYKPKTILVLTQGEIHMKFLVIFNLCLATAAHAGSFECNNAPEVEWGTYFCLSGDFNNTDEIVNISFGTCEGSDSAGEAEPVEIVEIKSAKDDVLLKAKSAEWKNASAFDLSTEELGEATLYIQPESFSTESKFQTISRLKAFLDGKAKDVRLNCRFFFEEHSRDDGTCRHDGSC